MEKSDVMINVNCNTPANVADNLSKTICVVKTTMSNSKLAILGIFAGVYIGFGACLATLVSSDAAKYVGLGLARFFTGMVFSVGLMLVVIAGAELFTGNNLMLMGVLDRKTSIGKMFSKWLIVYVANFIGAVFLAYLYYLTSLWKTGDNMAVGVNALKLANFRMNLTFVEALTRGILCNWLVCLAVWMALASREVIGKIFSCLFPIMVFVASGFEHCVANMYFIPMGIFLKASNQIVAEGLDLTSLTWANFFTKNLIPVTIGNIIGGGIFVACLYWWVYVRNTADKK